MFIFIGFLCLAGRVLQLPPMERCSETNTNVVCVISFSDQIPVLGSVLRNTDFVVAGVLCEPRKESEGDQ